MIRGHIQGNDSLEELKERLTVTITRNNHGELWTHNFLIGRGNETNRRNIENIINEFPSNEKILKGLTDLLQNTRNMENESIRLQREIGGIIGDINTFQCFVA